MREDDDKAAGEAEAEAEAEAGAKFVASHVSGKPPCLLFCRTKILVLQPVLMPLVSPEYNLAHGIHSEALARNQPIVRYLCEQKP